MADALTSPVVLFERLGTTGVPSDQTRKMLDRATRLAAALNRSPAQRAKVVRDLIEKVVIDENAITIRIRRSALSGGSVAPPSSENPSDSTIELTAAVAFKRRGVEIRLMLPGAAIPNDRSRCDPTLIKAIARGRAWFEEGYEPAHCGCFSLTGIDAVPPREIKALNEKCPGLGLDTLLWRVVLQRASRLR